MEIRNTRIASKLHEMFDGIVDITDVTDPQKKVPCFLSRSVASLALAMLSDVNAYDAAKPVTDGFNDMGLDLIYYDELSSRLILVQSKWIDDANGSPDSGSVLKFIAGVDGIINLNFQDVNEKIRNKQSEIEAAVKGMSAKVLLVLAYTGREKLSDDARKALDSFMNKIDEGTGEIISYVSFGQQEIYKFLSDGNNDYQINDEDVLLNNWGKLDDPYTAYYGVVSANTLVQWFAEHQQKLFDKNIRYFRGNTDVNEGIIRVLNEEPEHFFYYNNGIKVVCKSITRKLAGSTDTKTGLFSLSGISIVNGAQTTGAIYQAAQGNPEAVSKARVFVQLIDLGSMPAGSDVLITKLSNTQNKIENKDFAALDETQERIRQELRFEHKEYLYKSGSNLIDPTSQITFDEALVALACFNDDPTYAATAKRNIGALSSDVSKAPYKVIFNAGTQSTLIWNAIMMMRLVDKELDRMESNYQGKERLVLVHGNRVILHCIYKQAREQGNTFIERIMDDAELAGIVRVNLETIIEKLQGNFIRAFPDAYPANVFKNIGRIRTLITM